MSKKPKPAGSSANTADNQKAAALSKAKAPKLLQLSVDKLKPHPLLERVTMRQELAKIKERDWREFAEGEAQSWADFVADVKARGIQDPIHIVPGGTPEELADLIVDGRHRWLAAAEAGLATVPCIMHAAEEAEGIILGSVAQRKKLTQEAVAYLCVMMHPHLALEARRGRPSEADKFRNAAELTREDARRMAAVSMRTLEEACITFRFLDEHPAQRKKLEPLILAGAIGLGAARAGVAGAKATEDQPRVVKYFANCRTALAKWNLTLSGWADWTEEDRAAALALLPEAVDTWPAEVRVALLKSLNGEGGSK